MQAHAYNSTTVVRSTGVTGSQKPCTRALLQKTRWQSDQVVDSKQVPTILLGDNKSWNKSWDG